jgi:hypothetical protein
MAARDHGEAGLEGVGPRRDERCARLRRIHGVAATDGSGPRDGE